MGKHSEVSLWKKFDELQPSEAVAGGARAVVAAPDTLNKSTGPDFLKMGLESKWSCSVCQGVQSPEGV